MAGRESSSLYRDSGEGFLSQTQEGTSYCFPQLSVNAPEMQEVGNEKDEYFDRSDEMC